MCKRLTGKVAVVTGAGNGIGRAEALHFAREGAKVVVNDLGISLDGSGNSSLPATDVVREIKLAGGEAIANYDSVADESGANNIIKSAIDNFGRIDILVNNAGILRSHMIFNMSSKEWDEVLKVHLYGHFYCTKAACQWFRHQKSGRIVNTSSTAGLGVHGSVAYSAAKEGIIGFTRSVAIEMAKYNVTCNAIRPFATTRLFQSVEPVQGETKEKAERKQSFLSSLSDVKDSYPEDIAPLVVYLATDHASNISGHVFYICKGVVSIYQEPIPIKTIYKNGTWILDELINIFPSTLSGAISRSGPIGFAYNIK